MKSCTSTLVATFRVRIRSPPVDCWLIFWIGPRTTIEVEQETNEVLPRLEPVGDVPRLPTRVTHAHKSLSGRKKPPHPPLEKCHTCVNFTGLGSKAYYQIKTCLDCGHSTRTRCECVYKNDPAACKHDSTDRRGSSSFTARFFCKLCGTHVDEMPQEEARRRALRRRHSRRSRSDSRRPRRHRDS